MPPNADYVGQVDHTPPTKDEQIDYWQERYFALLDEHATLINLLQAIRRILDEPLAPNGRSETPGE